MRRIFTVLGAILSAGILTCTVIALMTHPHAKQQGPARIIAKEQAEVGQLVRLSVEADADDYMWIVVPASEDFEIYAEGQKAVFSARKPGSYLFIAAFCKNNKVSLLRHILKVKGPPKPINPPGPNASILELIPYWCHKYNIPPETSATLSKNFSTVAAKAAAGGFESVQELISSTADLNKGTEATRLLDAITKYIVAKAQSGELETMQDHIMLWNRIAAALSGNVYEVKEVKVAEKKE